jgi:hypothetical protein
MKSMLRRSCVLLAAAAAVTGLTVVVPSAALADTTAAVAESAAFAPVFDPPRCTPAHWGRHWLWHDDHWDHWEWDRGSNSGEWKHYRRDDRYCDGERSSGATRTPDG